MQLIHEALVQCSVEQAKKERIAPGGRMGGWKEIKYCMGEKIGQDAVMFNHHTKNSASSFIPSLDTPPSLSLLIMRKNKKLSFFSAPSPAE